MGKVVEFTASHSNAFNNLIQFIEISDTVRILSWYLEAIEVSKNKGYFKPGEYTKLCELGGQKLKKLLAAEMTI